jgi:hypothetical protein
MLPLYPNYPNPSGNPLNMTNNDLPSALVTLLLATSFYAFALNGTRLGREFTADQTWVTVVVGTLIVLLTLATVNLQTAMMALLFFFVGGLPMVTAAIIKEFLTKRHLADAAMKKYDTDAE